MDMEDIVQGAVMATTLGVIIILMLIIGIQPDPRPRAIEQAKLDTLYATVELIREDVNRVTDLLNGFCLELAVQHRMSHEDAHKFCDE